MLLKLETPLRTLLPRLSLKSIGRIVCLNLFLAVLAARGGAISILPRLLKGHLSKTPIGVDTLHADPAIPHA